MLSVLAGINNGSAMWYSISWAASQNPRMLSEIETTDTCETYLLADGPPSTLPALHVARLTHKAKAADDQATRKYRAA